MNIIPDFIKIRIDICHQCEKYDQVKNKCTKCGCYIPAKAALKLTSCPLDKWPK